ncbi:MAG: threonine dehydratase, partial [Bradyrhizobium sp.]|nr:threonine dehydratase [Bradyrhizobium sp.]
MGDTPTAASLAHLPVTLQDIEAAASVLDGFVKRTNFDHSRTLSDITGASLWLKFENLQFTATFKERGALNRLSALSADERQRGVIAASAGNHAQGVAYHAARLSIPATIVVPIGTPTVKIENTRRHGATVIEGGATLEDAARLATDHGRDARLTYIHPYDDPIVIAGQGTIALEMLAAVPDLDVLLVPIGGGGLISGIAVAAKTLKPAIEIIGVQAVLYPSMFNLIKGQGLAMRGDTL